MPSKLPIIKANTSQTNIDKMKYIAEKNKRSLAKELEFIIEKHIEEFEIEHGNIPIDETLKKEESTAIKVLKAASGVTLGEIVGDKIVEHIKK